MAHGKIYNNIVETVGGTPLVKLNRVSEGLDATIALKCEFFNPLGSVKDRIGMAMIEAAEAAGELTKESVIVEPTSGNTGIALAFVCAAKGYKLEFRRQIDTRFSDEAAQHIQWIAMNICVMSYYIGCRRH